jgi:hypothetical protein
MAANMKERDMLNKKIRFSNGVVWCPVAILIAVAAGCAPKPTTGLKKMAPGQEYSGFLSDYKNLKPNPNFEKTLSYVRGDTAKNLHKYVAILIEPVEIYVATDVDPAKIPDRGREAIAAYFQNALTNAVWDAYPVVEKPGPLVMRLRSALIGVDVGAENPAGGQPANPEELQRAVNIGKVGLEMELVDSETGEQIAAAVDRQNLGEGADVGSATFSREEKFRAARQAFDAWAARLRDFLDSAHELSPEDVKRADESYQPYGPELSR